MPDEKWYPGKATVGSYIRSQRELSRLSLRELARMSQVSKAYLSQVERGLFTSRRCVCSQRLPRRCRCLWKISLRRRVRTPRRSSPVVTSTQSPQRFGPSRGCPSLRRRHFSRCTPAIWQMAIHSGNPSIETWGRSGQDFVLTRSSSSGPAGNRTRYKKSRSPAGMPIYWRRGTTRKYVKLPADTRRVLMTSTRRRTTMCRDLP